MPIKMTPRLKLEVCAFFADEFRAALAAEERADVELVPIRGACDERCRTAPTEAPPVSGDVPTLCLMGVCSGRAACPKSPHSCFEFLLGPDKVEALLGEGAHLLTPAMVRAYPQTLQDRHEKPENLHAYFAESVRAWVVVDIGVVVDTGVAALTAEERADFLAATGGSMELLPTEPHLLRANLRAALAQGEIAALEARSAGQMASLQHRLADYTMAYDLIGRLIPHQGEQNIIHAILELFHMLCAPRAVHLLLIQGGSPGSNPEGSRDGEADTVAESVQIFSLPADSDKADSDKESYLRAFLRTPAQWGETGAQPGFYFQMYQGGQMLGAVVVEGEFLPEHQRNYLDLARLLMPILRLALHNAHSYELLCSTERELRASQMQLEQRVAERTAQLTAEIAVRKQGEQALREAEARFRSSFEAAAIGMALVSVEGRFVDVNSALCRLFGYPHQELTKKTFQELTYPDDLDVDLDYARQLVAGERASYQMEKRYFHKNGHIVWTLLTGSTVRDAQGKLLYFIAQIQDISKRRKYEEELKRSNADLEQFSYAISHDMRQPLRMISSYLQLIEMSLADQLVGEKRDYFTFAIDGAKRIDQMLVALLEYSRIGRMGEPPTWIDSSATLDEALQFLQPAITEAQANLSIAGDWPRIFVSHDEIQRLVQNLIGNAIKYRVAGRIPEITVSSEIVNNEWRLCVTDNGVGIIPEQSKRLFQVFQRLHSHEAYEGTGIGLALCRKIAEHHRGRIWAESAGEGQGSRFCVLLPVLREKT
ncbi:MAG: PAS domain S-box protein [Sulfuricellaceae bacterium]